MEQNSKSDLSELTDSELTDNDFPSKIFNAPWVYTSSSVRINYPVKNKRPKGGKWLIFIANEQIDLTWQKIKKATKEGLLGTSSKVATSQPSQYANSETEKVICVYTYDSDDIDDINRIENALREIGIFSTLCYKTNEATSKGNYSVRGSKNICKYVSRWPKTKD